MDLGLLLSAIAIITATIIGLLQLYYSRKQVTLQNKPLISDADKQVTEDHSSEVTKKVI